MKSNRNAETLTRYMFRVSGGALSYSPGATRSRYVFTIFSASPLAMPVHLFTNGSGFLYQAVASGSICEDSRNGRLQKNEVTDKFGMP